MKRICHLLLISTLMIGCQKNETIDHSDIQITDERIEFEVIKSEACEYIAPSNQNSDTTTIYSQADYVFVDMIFKTVNISHESINVDTIYAGTLQMNDQTYSLECIAENADYNQLTNTGVILPTESRYFHLYCEVPKDQIVQEGTIKLSVLDEKKYTYTFRLDGVEQKRDEKSLGDVLSLEQSQISLNLLFQADRVEPSYKGFIYKYIPTDDEKETFIILQIDLKNISSVALMPQKYLACEYVINDQVIPAKVIVESDNHQTLLQKEMIHSQESRTIYLAMPIEKSLKDIEGKVYLYVEEKTFEIGYHIF